ncbi:MAG: hypothetical protein U0T75_16305 [Chitinophagales bacterium]
MFSVTPVSTSVIEKQFYQLPYRIYKGDNNWIAPLKQDVKKVFDPKLNTFFSNGECQRWIATNDQGETIGRIAAFIDKTTAFTEAQPTGGCGFFECIDNKEAAFLLFDTAANWLKERGMQAMDGPINFGERNAWWGLLVEGFTPATYQMNYNPSYYQTLFEAYGFRDYFQQYSYGLNITQKLPERYKPIVERLKRSGDYTFRYADKSNLRKYARDFSSVFNRAWQFLPNYHPMTEEQAWKIFKSFKPVMVDYLAWFGYYRQEPIATFIMLPELNGWFKHVNGNLNFWGLLKFLWIKTFDKSNRKVFGIVFGVVPEQQRKGVEAAIVLAADEVVRPSGRWDEIELTWIGDFNAKMIKTCEALGAQLVKRHITYRKLFDANAAFKRHPLIE